MGKTANYRRERERDRRGESESVTERCSERHLEIPEFGENMCLQKEEGMPQGTSLRLMRHLRKIDNDSSHDLTFRCF